MPLDACPSCRSPSLRIAKTRPKKTDPEDSVRRTRTCDVCGESFPTLELPEQVIQEWRQAWLALRGLRGACHGSL